MKLSEAGVQKNRKKRFLHARREERARRARARTARVNPYRANPIQNKEPGVQSTSGLFTTLLEFQCLSGLLLLKDKVLEEFLPLAGGKCRNPIRVLLNPGQPGLIEVECAKS